MYSGNCLKGSKIYVKGNGFMTLESMLAIDIFVLEQLHLPETTNQIMLPLGLDDSDCITFQTLSSNYTQM